VTVKRTEAEECWVPTTSFKGICQNNDDCATVCRREGAIGGECRSFLLLCYCTRPCSN